MASNIPSFNSLLFCSEITRLTSLVKSDSVNLTVLFMFLLLLIVPFIFYPDDFIKYSLFAALIPIFIYTFTQKEFGSRWCQSFFIFDMFVLGKLLIQGA